MSDFKYDLAVAYRIYPKVSSHPPPIFADDKLKLAELCLKSFKASLGNLKVKIWVLLDNCPPAYEEMFSRLWSYEDLVLLRYPGVGDAATFREQSRLLMEQTDAEIVYLAEDDYFYLPDQFPLAVNFLKQTPTADFVSPYDHPDIYTTELHNLPHETKMFLGKEWNSCISTTHTFLTTRATLIQSRSVFLASYGRISPDLAKWMALTKGCVFNPFRFISWLVSHRFWAASVFFAWYFCWRQILFGRKYSLWIPHPSIANHMAAGMEAPGIDWRKEFDQNSLKA
ncbi:MAG TPA: hypothetical protein VMD27_00795 [Candidatus Aquilonibacter sp.]|nr:hypothetical protein [Candidatus Aquilonibacter sp.]